MVETSDAGCMNEAVALSKMAKHQKNQRCIHAEGDAFAQPNQILAPRVRGRENSDDTVIKFAVERLSFSPSRLRVSRGD